MNALAWAKDLFREGRISKNVGSKVQAAELEKIANNPCPHCGTPEMMGLAWSRRYFFQQLAKDMNRAVKERGTDGKQRRVMESVRIHDAPPIYAERKKFSLAYFEDRLRHCREQIAYYTEKAKGLLADAIERGHKQLSLKFPEFK